MSLMSATDGRADGSGELEQLPEFDLSYLFDDGESPASVTVYDPDAPDTGWIAADISGTVAIEDLR